LPIFLVLKTFFIDEANKFHFFDGIVIYEEKNLLFATKSSLENKCLVFGANKKAQESFLAENIEEIRNFFGAENFKHVHVEAPDSLKVEPEAKKQKLTKQSSPRQIKIMSTINEHLKKMKNLRKLKIPI